MRVQVSPRAQKLREVLDFVNGQMYLVPTDGDYMKLLRYLLLALLFTSTMVLAEIIRSGSLQASSDGINVTLHWITDDETSVAHFEVERRSGTDGAFVSLATIDAKGPSAYEFIDNSAFRKIATIYQYRIKVTYNNSANTTYSSILTVTHTVSGVRRTWGSIKSMFR